MIWSEGAIFIMGFEEGLRARKPFVKKGGYMVVSDADCFESDPPRELMAWWEEKGDVPTSKDEMKEWVKRAGLRLLATFRLPEEGWWENYHVPMLERLASLRKTSGDIPEKKALLDALEDEAENYRKYKRYYGYTFFVMQNP